MEIYLTDLTSATEDTFAALVSEERLEQSRRYAAPADRLRSLAAGALLNYAVKELFPHQKVPVTPSVGLHGKPQLDFMEFSLSHTGNYAACAVSTNPVGIDIERPRPFRPALASRFFTDAEATACTGSDSFTICWTLKESFLKATGFGMKLPLSAFEIKPADFGDTSPLLFEYAYAADHHRYFGKTYRAPEGCRLSVCSRDTAEFPDDIRLVSFL